MGEYDEDFFGGPNILKFEKIKNASRSSILSARCLIEFRDTVFFLLSVSVRPVLTFVKLNLLAIFSWFLLISFQIP